LIGAVYLQNVYHAEDNEIQSTNLNELLRVIDSYNRKMLIEQQQFRHVNNLELVQIHTVFELSVFQGKKH
jgi:hypothetical protein